VTYIPREHGVGGHDWNVCISRPSYVHTDWLTSKPMLLHFTWGIPEAKCILVTRVCVSVCLSLAAFPHYCTDPDVTWGNGRECPLVVHYGQTCNRCTGFVAMTTSLRARNISECLFLLYAWLSSLLGTSSTFIPAGLHRFRCFSSRFPERWHHTIREWCAAGFSRSRLWDEVDIDGRETDAESSTSDHCVL